jgi:hypothetical protein
MEGTGVQGIGVHHSDVDIELKMLMEAIYMKYSYDFRDYTGASQKRRVLHALQAKWTAPASRRCRRASCTSRPRSASCCNT